MKVICPKCQFENQADSARVVCARCATIIEVRLDQTSGLDGNGKRQTARLPFAANSGNSQSASSQPLNINSQQLNPSRDLYATRIGDDFDDVLDIPRPVQSNSQTSYDSPIFDDVFTTPDYDYTAAYDYSTTEKKSTSQVDNYQASLGNSRPRGTQDYVAAAEPEFMGWPLLPENSIDEEDSVSESKSRRGGLVVRIVICVVVFGGLIGGAYYFLGDLIKNREKESAQNTPGGAPSGARQSNSVDAKDDAKPSTSDGANTRIVDGKTPPKDSKQIPIAPKAEGPTGTAPAPAPPKPATTGPVPVPDPFPNKGTITLQIASFKDLASANERLASLKQAGVKAAEIVDAEIPGNGTWHRIRIGRFENRDEARIYGDLLKSRGAVEDYLVTPAR